MQTEPPVQISTEHKTLMANCKNCFLSEKGLPGTLKKKKKVYFFNKENLMPIDLTTDWQKSLPWKKSIIDKSISTKLSIQI